MEKKARQKKLDDKQKKLDEKLQSEMNARRRLEEDKKYEKQYNIEKKKKDIEISIKLRQENRQKSVVDMIERTKQISHGGIRQNASNTNLLPLSQQFIEKPDNLFKVPTPKVKKGIEKRQDDMMRRNSQKYDTLMKQKRDEIKRKRGALDLNSDLDDIEDYGLNNQQKRGEADLPSGIQGTELSNYKSKLH